VDLAEHGAADLEGDFLDWKWDQGVAPDGRIVGLGTDIGGLGMCYDTELFGEAGLPTDREEVGELWPTWDDYAATGEEFTEADTGAAFMSTVQTLFRVLTAQAVVAPFQITAGALDCEVIPPSREAYDTTTSCDR